MPPVPDVEQALADVTAGLAGAEDRPGQRAMAGAVARAIADGRHLVVSAGTGTGKSLAYLVPVVLAGRPVVVATVTKALQDQLAGKDLPLVGRGLRAGGLTVAVLKGRSNYLCRQRAREVGGAAEEPGVTAVALLPPAAGTDGGDAGAFDEPDGPGPGSTWAPDGPAPIDLGRFGTQIRRLIAWAEASPTGDRAELEFEPHPRAWAALSVTARECPGAYRCPSGTVCFAERARERAAAADVVVVNTHLYASHVAAGGGVLPEHDVVVLDEAHALEDVMTAALGVELTAGRLRAVAQAARAVVARDGLGDVDAVSELADRFDAAVLPRLGGRVLLRRPARAARGARAQPSVDDELRAVLGLCRSRLDALAGVLRRADAAGVGDDDASARRNRALLALGHLAEEVAAVATLDDDHVAWVEGTGAGARSAALRAAPVDVGPLLAERLWPGVTAVLTSATVPQDLETRLGLPAASTDRVSVESPFPFATCALLYCAAHLPDPRRPGAAESVHAELASLVRAAGGRTLALFTSRRAMQRAAEALHAELDYPILVQGDRPKARLLEAFSAEDATCLFATMSFWQGVDVPGSSLSLVTVDRLPFPRPDDPLLEARRERAGAGAFRAVDLPRAATLLAQGAGRLIRASDDRGVVAVLDSRLARAGYRGVLLSGLPPMRRTTDHAEAVAFLEELSNRAAR